MKRIRHSLGPNWKLRLAARSQNGKPFNPVSIETRQQERAKDRKASLETVNEHYRPEPRQARRNISRVWARNLMHERQAAARRRQIERDARQRLQGSAA